MTQDITITTGSRLHFGLIGWGPEHARQFGGLGVMIAPPFLTVRISSASNFTVAGPLSDRLATLVQRLMHHWQLEALPPCRVEILSAPPEHSGLGTGTAHALAVASAMATFLKRKAVPIEELALATGRGLRSAVGAHGFVGGGLIYEDGKAPGEHLGRLQSRVNLPAKWRFVLIQTNSEPGLAGHAERRAFDLVRSTSLSTAAKLRTLATTVIVPAARSEEFETFSNGIADYNRLAGSCFSTVQNQDYSNAEIAELVDALRQRGFQGAGQSSWGPTVFVAVSHEAAACELVAWLGKHRRYGRKQITIASPFTTNSYSNP